jgi:hypothetical protein
LEGGQEPGVASDDWFGRLFFLYISTLIARNGSKAMELPKSETGIRLLIFESVQDHI